MDISLSNRLKIDCRNGTYAIDGTPKSDEIGVLTHAHADHLPNNIEPDYICSNLTSSLGSLRIGSFNSRDRDDNVELINAGHIPGSRAVLIDDGRETALITGDFNTRDTNLSDGFEFNGTVDYLVTESTYGKPRYNFPSKEKLESDILDWFRKVSDRRIVCRGYSLGRAQEIELLARKAGINDIVVNNATRNINRRINKFRDLQFSTEKLNNVSELENDQLYITSNRKDIKKTKSIFSNEEVVNGAFTGWALGRDYEDSTLFDEGFPLSDHSDYNGLLQTVRKIQPDKVYTVHGYKNELADSIISETESAAESLKKNQKTLSDFG